MAISQSIQEEVLKEAYSATPNYSVDFEDERLTSVTDKENAALSNNKALYGDMIDNADDFYTDLQDKHQAWADEQVNIQQQQTDFTIRQIEQQKEQAEKDYLKEQSGAYVDWQKQSNKYGTEAEKMASAGLTNTGYSESSQVSMYNTYQNRVATAREVLAKAKLNYDNGIKEAMLQNSAAIAEIYATNYIKQAELALQGFQYKNDLLLEQANKELEIKNMYHNQWMDVLNQINTENAMAEEVRQFTETQKWNTEQAERNREHDKEIKELQFGYDKELQRIQNDYDVAMAKKEQEYKIAYLNASTTKEKEILDKQHELAIKELNQKLENEKALAKYEYDLNKIKITGSSSGTRKIVGNSGPVKTNSSRNTVNLVKNSVGKVGGGGFTGSTYKEAVDYMKKKGVPSSAASGVMTASEWSRRRNSYSMTGQGSVEVKNYNSYQAYLRAYVDYRVGNK